MVLDPTLNLFQRPRVAVTPVAILAVVIAAGIIVTQARKRVI